MSHEPDRVDDELRVDVSDGNLYSKEEFYSEYGDLVKWEMAPRQDLEIQDPLQDVQHVQDPLQDPLQDCAVEGPSSSLWLYINTSGGIEGRWTES